MPAISLSSTKERNRSLIVEIAGALSGPSDFCRAVKLGAPVNSTSATTAPISIDAVNLGILQTLPQRLGLPVRSTATRLTFSTSRSQTTFDLTGFRNSRQIRPNFAGNDRSEADAQSLLPLERTMKSAKLH